MKFKKKHLLLPVLALSIGALAACGSADDKKSESGASGDKNVLIVGTSADYAPFEYVDTKKSDKIVGFDIDLAYIIADELGYELEFKDSSFNSLIPGLQAGKYDFVISGMTPTAKRDEVVDFSTPYYETEQYLVFNKEENYDSLDDLKGEVVGAQLSSIQEDLANDFANEKGFKVESRDLIPEVVQDLKNGRIQGAVIENIVAENYLAQNDDLAAFPIEVEDPDYKAIAFPEGSKLKEEFDEVILELVDNGKIEKLKKKWFVVED